MNQNNPAVVDSRVGRAISANDALHQYPQTSSEWFISFVKDFHEELTAQLLKTGQSTTITIDNIDPEIQFRYWDMAKTKQTTYGEIVSTKPVMVSLLALIPFVPYYGHTKMFQPNPIRR